MSESSRSANKINASRTTAPPAATRRWQWSHVRAEAVRLKDAAHRKASSLWRSPQGQRLRSVVMSGRQAPYSGIIVIVGGVAVVTLLIALVESVLPAPNPGVLYLPLAAFVAYYWSLRHGIATSLLALICVYLFLIPPAFALKTPSIADTARLLTDAAVLVFILALARLAARRRERSEREASRFASLTSIGLALASELDEEPLLKLIAQTACDLTGADFAAFTLRPVDSQGQPLVPSLGDLFHLAAVVGVTPEQEESFRRAPLGGEGLLAPIFRHARAVRVPDAEAVTPAHAGDVSSQDHRDIPSRRRARALAAARSAAQAYAEGGSDYRSLRGVGIPSGHPTVRSFLGAPLLDRSGQVRGGLLLGHAEPDRFTEEDERLLVGLASQAATALENAHLFSAAESRARELDVIFDSISDGLSLVGLDGEVIRENRVARALRAQFDSLPGDVPAALERLVARATAGQPQASATSVADPAPQSLQITTGESEPREYHVSAAPVRVTISPARPRGDSIQSSQVSAAVAQGAMIGAIVIWRDVTEARQLIVERRAREVADAQRMLLQTIVDELPSGVYLTRGADARLVLANRTALTVWGAEWRAGQPMIEFMRAHGIQVLKPDGRPLADDELSTIRSVRTGQAIQHQEEIIRQPNGAHLPILLNTVTVSSSLLGQALQGEARSDPGSVDEHTAIVVLQDVTPLKEAERLKDEFIALAAHELKTPMAAVKGYADMLTRGPVSGLGAPLEDWQREALEAIDSATIRLVELTNDLLDVARLQADRLELRREPTDLVALARRVSRRMQVTTERHMLRLETSEDYVVADVDAARIEQVLGNLLSNAIKYSPDGGEVRIKVGKSSASAEGEQALICVQDTGIGIPKEQQSRLFSRFVRAENARERSIGGTGLGLYLCREILARHGGRIWLESELNQGSVFSIELPLNDIGDGVEEMQVTGEAGQAPPCGDASVAATPRQDNDSR
jgi:signal transduction histidine kinase